MDNKILNFIKEASNYDDKVFDEFFNHFETYQRVVISRYGIMIEGFDKDGCPTICCYHSI